MDQAKKTEFELEYYEKYYGGSDKVKDEVENCPHCGSKFFFTHSCDYGNLVVKETATCTQCNFGQRKIISSLN